MKKILSVFLLSFVVILSACGSSDEKPEAAEPEEVEKDNEMTETAAINYLEQITHRYLKASDHEEGSFEQKSELQAGIKQIDAAIEEIKEVYEEDLPIASKITDLANGIKNTLQGMLNRDFDKDEMETKNYSIGVLIGDISGEYLEGEMPPTLKFRMQMDEALIEDE